jgi:ketosteroid isomerase-like protein
MVHNSWLVAAALVVVCGAAVAQPPIENSWEREVRAAEAQHVKAFLANDVAALDEMFSDDFMVNSPLNTLVEKKQLLEMVRGGTLALASFEQQIEQVRRYGDVVVVMGSDTATFAPSSRFPGVTQRRRFTDLWRHDGKRWLFVARQASLICS